MRWNDRVYRYGYIFGMMGVALGAMKQLQAAEIPPLTGGWAYSANECTNFSNASTWAADCQILDGGIWTGSNTASDPLRCENPVHPRPWPSEGMIEPLASARSGGTATLQGWQEQGESVHCTGLFDTASPETTLGVESSNFSLISIDDEPGAWGARRDREIKCPTGSWKLSDSCQQFPIADPYRAFEFCPKNGTNPINAFSGAKIHIETDVRVQGPNPLNFVRYYSTRTQWRHSPWEKSGFGIYWRHNYAKSVTHFKNDDFEAVTIFKGNGNRIYFVPVETEGERVWRITEPGVPEELSEVEINGEHYWDYRKANGSAERYDKTNGRLDHIVTAQGFVTTCFYNSAGLLVKIDNGFGRSLVLEYGASGLAKDLIISVSLEVNQSIIPESVIRYAYEQTDPSGYVVMLDKIIYPDETPADAFDNPFKDYLYNEGSHIYYDEQWKVDVTDGPSNRSANHPSKLTGIIDENGNRFATYKYQRVLFSGGYRFMLPVWGGHGSPDANGKFANAYRVSRYHPDSHRSDSRSHDGYATIEDALGNSRQFHFANHNGVLRPTTIVGDQCEVCGSNAKLTNYDSNGFISETIDFAGNKTLYNRDELGLERCRLEGVSVVDSNKNAPRKITTTWDHRYRLPLLKQVYAPGTDADLTTCEPDNDNGWIKRFEVTRQYEPDSGRLAQISKQSFGVTGLADELPRVTTFRYYAEGEQGGMQYQLKEIDGPRSDVIDVQRFRYAIDHSSDHNPGDLIEIENALGHQTKFTRHDAFGRVVESLDPNGVLSSTEYHPRGWMKTRSIGDYQLAFEYDGAGQLIKVIQSGGDVIEYRYDSAHRLTDITDGFGNYIHYELDPAGNRVSEKIFDSHGTLRKHLERIINSANRIEKAISFVDLEHQNARGFIYDGNGDLLEDIDPRDPAINADGPLPSEPTIYSSRTYDALRRPIEIRNKEGGLTTIAYDVFDNITHVTEPSDGNVSTPQGLSTHYKYNSFGELKQLDSPDSGITKFSYDGAGNLITRETAGQRTQGEKINYYYDALNRLRLVDYPTNQQDISYEYDRADEQQYGIGRLHQIIDESGTTSLTHDRHGNIVEISFLRDGLLTSIKYSFSGAKQLASITTPSGKEIRRTFQAPVEGATSNLISSIELYDQHSAQVLIDDVHYAPFGPLESWEYHNGLSARRRFDLDYQVSGISHGNFVWRDYLLDAAANITQITDMLSGNVETFSYDGLERLITANAAQLSTTYHYDAIGNRREVVTDLLTQNYFYAPETHHLIKTDGIASREFEFDLDGNVITSGDLRFHYANDGRPKVVRTGQDVIASFKHNALGRRTEKDIGYKIFYYYDLAGRLLEEGDQFGNAHKTYVYLEDTLVAMLEEEINPFEDSDEDGMRNGYETNFGFSAFDPSDANLDADNDSYSNLSEHDAGTDPRDPNDSPAADTHLVKQIPAIGTVTALLAALAVLALLLPQINSAPLVVSLVLVLSWFVAQTANAEIHYVHTDHLGTPIMMTDEHQVITWQARYTPFGLAVVDSGSTTELNLRFPGQYFDQETGFHYNYFRDYDPSTGRYLQSDPIGLHGGINTFVYALGNPLKYLDRFGLWVMRCARKLGSPDSAPVAPSGNPLRHDYLSVSGSILSFQAGTGNGWRDMFKSQGWIDTRNERPTNSKCKMVCEDDDFDQFVFEASSEIGAPTYCIIPGMPGAENCQTWASDVLKLAKKNYLESVPCPKCFVKDNSRFLQNFRDDFGRAL